ncbi:MAG: ParA family protein [Solirubrobacterales bacterium]
MAVTIAVLSQKGGTGKTTLVRTLADVFERLGLDTLAVDADPQGNLSDYFDTDRDAQPTLADVLQGQVRAAEAVHGPVIPANLRLAEAELALAGKIGREVTLRNALRDLKRQRELILIDCPPTLGLLTVNALVAADHAVLSTEAQYFSLQGVEQAVQVLDLARDSLNPELDLLAVVLNIANMRTKHARQTLEGLRERFGDRVCRTVIRQSIAYAESAERAIPILDYRPDRGADYLSLAGELLRRLSRPELLTRLDELSAELVPTGAGAKRRRPGAAPEQPPASQPAEVPAPVEGAPPGGEEPPAPRPRTAEEIPIS